MAKDSWGKDTCELVRHRKLGSYELYIYKCAGHYVLDELERPARGHNITYGRRLDTVLATYNRCVREAQAMRGV